MQILGRRNGKIEIIKSKNNLCTGCNRCVRKCPMETANTTYQDEVGNIKVKINHDMCIACGRCVSACKHNARYFADDLERFISDLSSGAAISLIIAPSIKTNIPGYKKLFTYLKQIGVNKIYDAALGADICVWGHIKHINLYRSLPIITQPCPAIVTYCRIYRHDLLPRLSPIHSPIACASVYMRKYKGINDRIAALSPCIAKTNEFEDTGLAQYNVTFATLLEYLAENTIKLPEEETEFDHDESGLGSLFPMPGGLKENIEYFMGKKLHIAKAEGFNVYEKLNQYADTPTDFLPEIYDVLNCTEGCNMGSAYSHDRSMFEIDKTMDDARRRATEKSKREHYDALYKIYDETFALADFTRSYTPVPLTVPRITSTEIKEAFNRLGKTDYEKQHVDCGACGSDTCYGMARKVALNVNIPANCIIKSKEDAGKEHEENLSANARLAKLENEREANERMQVMLDATPLAAHFWDENLNVIDCNRAAVKMFNLTNKQEYIDRYFELTPEFQPDGSRSSDKLKYFIDKTYSEGRQQVEWMRQTTDGEPIPVEITFVRVEFKEKNLIAGYCRDLREQKRMLGKIEAANLTTATMFESNPHINILFNHELKVIACNIAALKFMGFDTKEEMFYGFTQFIENSIPTLQSDGRVSMSMRDRFLIAIREGHIRFSTELIMRGVRRSLDVEFKKIPYDNSFAIVGYIFDTTDIREREMELTRAKELNEIQLAKLNLVVEASKIGLWDMNVIKDSPVGGENVIEYSDNFKRMIGYSDEKEFPNVLGSWIDCLHPDDKERSIDAFEKHLLDITGKTPFDVEYRLMKKNGEYAYYRATGATIRDKNGNPIRVAGMLMDITETKNIILDTERQRIAAEAANKAKSSFLSTMSHEMRTPMNAIIGMTTIGKSVRDIGKKDDALSKIDVASKHLLGVINDVLDMSKIEADKFELSPVGFNFEKMLQKIADVINFRVDEKRQKFYVNIGKDIPRTLIGDDQRLSQIIANLLSNAVKFTPEGGTIRLDSELISQEDDYYRIQISVSDTGIGITDEQKARLFRSFEQAEAGTSRKFGGTGLGLAISKRIAELMGGNIRVESEPGKGSNFIFDALLKSGVDEQAPLLAAGVNWKNIRIFVVDDKAEILDFFKLVSERQGNFCTVAASGAEALEKLETEDVCNIYFIDWRLPDMDGGELTRHIRKKAEQKPIVIVCSSIDWHTIEDEARVAGIDKFLYEPLFPSSIINVINECMGVENATAAEKKSAGQTDDFSKYTILLAEDVEINREIIETLLEPTGITVESAENGAEALCMFTNAPDKYNMIFMDIQMPEMDGYEATKKIRQLCVPNAKSIPIIAMTANVFREDIEKCLEAGMNSHVGKPVDFDEVIKQLRKYLR